MHNLKTIYLKELKSYFNSPMAYIFLVIFAIINGYFFTRTFFLFNQSDMRSLFNIIPLVYLFFIPAITMSLIAREKNLGTMEVMSTLPLTDWDFVLGKLKDKGLIKIKNFSKNKNKVRYLYLLTPKGIAENTDLTIKFMKLKMKEYEELKKEIGK